MKEFSAIVEELEKSAQEGKTAVLATIISAQGSTYRRPGAHMLVTEDERVLGTISGGCLEADITERAQEVIGSGKSMIVTYDTTSATDIVWGLGLGCNGLVRVFVERLTPHQQEYVEFLSQCYRSRQKGVVATMVRVADQVQEPVGNRLMLQQEGHINNQIANSALAVNVLADAKLALLNNHSSVKLYKLPAGDVEIFIEVIQPPLPLVIFGAGHDAVPVARFAKELGWHVTIVDSRQSNATQERFPTVDAVIIYHPKVIKEHVTLDHHTVAVVMTHNYIHDRELLKTLLPFPLPYLGILGPKSRTERLLEELKAEGFLFTQEQLLKLYGPVGIDIGADTPEAIALAIIAEIQAVVTNRSGGLLRDRTEPIHDRVDDENAITISLLE